METYQTDKVCPLKALVSDAGHDRCDTSCAWWMCSRWEDPRDGRCAAAEITERLRSISLSILSS